MKYLVLYDHQAEKQLDKLQKKAIRLRAEANDLAAKSNPASLAGYTQPSSVNVSACQSVTENISKYAQKIRSQKSSVSGSAGSAY